VFISLPPKRKQAPVFNELPDCSDLLNEVAFRKEFHRFPTRSCQNSLPAEFAPNQRQWEEAGRE
jgi:hypothetical protein